MMDAPVIFMHETDHHCVVSAALAAAYKNCWGDINLKEVLDEVIKRGTILPYGICAEIGVCGGAANTGFFTRFLPKQSSSVLTSGENKTSWLPSASWRSAKSAVGDAARAVLLPRLR